jgi:tagatose 6-phosphate kinase
MGARLTGDAVILTVTLNFAVDVTYHVDEIRVGQTTPITAVYRQAGGKGVNVARVLHALGEDVLVSGLAGGSTGAAARSELASAGIADQTMSIAGDSRTTLVLVDAMGRATSLSEPGAEVSPDEWQRWLAEYGMLLGQVSAVVIAGSVPRGVPDDAYGQLVRIARRRGLPVLLDASGDALALGIAQRPSVVKVNAQELAAIAPDESALEAASRIQADGPAAVVVTDGPGGMLAITDEGRWRCAPPREIRGNPTGAGDAASAALILGVLRGTAWPEQLADAVALSAAAVAAPLAGAFDPDAYERLRTEVSCGLA